MRIRAGLLVAALALMLWAFAAPGRASVPPGYTCQMGGPPTVTENHQPGDGPNPLSDVLVVGCPQFFNGPAEVIAFDSDLGFCVGVDFVRTGGGFGRCGGARPDTPIRIDGFTQDAGKQAASAISGPVRPDVATVSAAFRDRRKTRRVDGFVAQVSGELLARLHQENPFGYFIAVSRGCLHGGARATASSGDGQRLGSDRLRLSKRLKRELGNCSGG